MKRLILALAALFMIVAVAGCESPETSSLTPKPVSRPVTPGPTSVPTPSPTPEAAKPKLMYTWTSPPTTPKPTPTTTTTPSPVPPPTPPPISTTTEKVALVVDSGKMEKVTLWLNPGDKVDGKITVIPRDLDFIVKDPNGDLALNAGSVTDKAFTFKAGVRGNYQLLFLDNSPSVLSKVVLLQLQHPGGPLFPPYDGIYLALKPREVKTINALLYETQGLKASFTIQGGEKDIGFSVRNPDGTMVIPPMKVFETNTSIVNASALGTYQLRFENSTNLTAKLVSLRMFTNPGGEWKKWWEEPAKLAFSATLSGVPGSPFYVQPVVKVLDGNGDTASTSSAEVTLTITGSTGTSGAKLFGPTTVTAVNGVATFRGLGISLAGTMYALTATAKDLFPVTSTPFNVFLTTAPTGEEYSLSVVMMPTKGGSVSISPKTSTYPRDTIVTLTATPAENYKFVGWGGDLSGTVNPINIIIDSNKRVTASFVPLSWQ